MGRFITLSNALSSVSKPDIAVNIYFDDGEVWHLTKFDAINKCKFFLGQHCKKINRQKDMVDIWLK